MPPRERRRHRRGARDRRRGALPLILVDANILIYAHVQGFAQHERARAWLDDRLNGTAQVGLPWPSVLSFLRLVTNPRVFEHPASIRAAWHQVEEWLDCEAAWIPLPTERHPEVLARLLTEANVRANLVPDAHLAALAIEHGLMLASTDGDFARFPGLRLENPLAAPVES
ncbi:MAG TPA: type II toxin-antitoxin system VapC family toxin [Myxococcota bacterium]|nr:type II toxin-antitoxin system VapC family toxin [Myxococcota bacterium]